jgi:hypothetical protein
MLCSLCTGIFKDEFPHSFSKHYHHNRRQDLHESAAGGCHLCTLVEDSLGQFPEKDSLFPLNIELCRNSDDAPDILKFNRSGGIDTVEIKVFELTGRHTVHQSELNGN